MSARSNPEKHVVLPGSRRAHRPGAQVLGRSDPHEWFEITVLLNRQAPLPEPEPGKVVILENETDKYGASRQDIDAVIKSFTSYGLTLVSVDPAAREVKLAGPVERMEEIFKTHLFRTKHGDHLYRSRVGELSIPEELSGKIQGVFGLDTRPMIRGRRKRNQLQAAPSERLPLPGQRPWFTPQELAEAYDFPANDASGKTVGIIELGGHYVPSDLKQFAQL